MSLWLIRHPKVEIKPGICYGRLEVPLAENYRAEVAAIRAQLPNAPETVWSSPAVHCQRAALGFGGKVKLDARLLELDFGQWEGRRWDSFHGEESEAWARDPWSRRPPGGETGEEMEARVAEVRREILAAARGHGLAVVLTHGGVIRIWRRLAEGCDRAESLEWNVPCGSMWEAK